ncbi:hypothetical protein CVT26_000360 [Gymnopilus dilepis]|uniref:Uncharacterized protein n=1 Tax=Gymnopilus dilepis TaxID=231916 RepID=A0A409VHM3_9AGAR|nr:hypothetical protein CVT26_000360 [Gymnopilus dilepis]
MQSSTSSAPTSATQTKERLYAQLAASLGRTARAISQTADLCEQLQVDLHAMRVFAGLDAAKFMTVAASLNPESEEEEYEQQQQQREGEEENVSEDRKRAQPQKSTSTSKDKQ